MKTIMTFALGAVVALTMAGFAPAQERKAETGRAEVYKTPDLLGKTVKNREGTTLGTLDDLVINTEGKVVYAALHFKDGNTSKMFALPFKAFRMSDDIKHLVLDVEKGQLDRAQGFDAKHWPTQADAGVLTKGAAETANPGRRDADDGKRDDIRRASSLSGMTVKNDKGEELGTVQGFAIDLPAEKVVYAALAHGGVAGVGAKYFAIPVSALKCANPTLRTQDYCFVLNATKADFEATTGFDRSQWPTKADERFLKPGR
jgi:sporulation protein YlmC with PRC-barrel domain